jgi:hypothetical protein
LGSALPKMLGGTGSCARSRPGPGNVRGRPQPAGFVCCPACSGVADLGGVAIGSGGFHQCSAGTPNCRPGSGPSVALCRRSSAPLEPGRAIARRAGHRSQPGNMTRKAATPSGPGCRPGAPASSPPLGSPSSLRPLRGAQSRIAYASGPSSACRCPNRPGSMARRSSTGWRKAVRRRWNLATQDVVRLTRVSYGSP